MFTIEIKDAAKLVAEAVKRQLQSIDEATTQEQIDDRIKQLEDFQAEITKQIQSWYY